MTVFRALQRPWLVALLSGSGLTLLLPCSAALIAPLPLLDAAVVLGDRRLQILLASLFFGSTGMVWLLALLWRGRGQNIDTSPEIWTTASRPAPHPTRNYLR